MGEGEPCGTCQACRNAEYSRDKVVSALELQNKRVAAAWKLCDRVTQRGEGPTFAYDLAVKIETALDACYEESKNAG
jgi:NADH:ubiquinone oxidoreductase subunit F (NADH-binding)